MRTDTSVKHVKVPPGSNKERKRRQDGEKQDQMEEIKEGIEERSYVAEEGLRTPSTSGSCRGQTPEVEEQDLAALLIGWCRLALACCWLAKLS